jgi:hypothetical protein
MDKKRIVEQAKDLAIANWRDKIIRLNRLETDIQGMIREFVEITGVQIKDIQLYDPNTGEVQFETDL